MDSGLHPHHVEEKRLKPASKESAYAFRQLFFRRHPDRRQHVRADVSIDRGEIRKRKKEPSKRFREQFGYTPLSIEEEILWQCRQLVIGSGAYGRLPVMQGVQREADRHNIKLLVLLTIEAIEVLKRRPKDTIAILHVTR